MSMVFQEVKVSREEGGSVDFAVVIILLRPLTERHYIAISSLGSKCQCTFFLGGALLPQHPLILLWQETAGTRKHVTSSAPNDIGTVCSNR